MHTVRWKIVKAMLRQAQHNVIQQTEIALSHGRRPSSLLEKDHAHVAAWKNTSSSTSSVMTFTCRCAHSESSGLPRTVQGQNLNGLEPFVVLHSASEEVHGVLLCPNTGPWSLHSVLRIMRCFGD
eukprot:Skav227794  [mRNA]  locus=scaffold948:34669:35043:+ [translate_table: standard]